MQREDDPGRTPLLDTPDEGFERQCVDGAEVLTGCCAGAGATTDASAAQAAVVRTQGLGEFVLLPGGGACAWPTPAHRRGHVEDLLGSAALGHVRGRQRPTAFVLAEEASVVVLRAHLLHGGVEAP